MASILATLFEYHTLAAAVFMVRCATSDLGSPIMLCDVANAANELLGLW
jgi:hypothetical protein